MIGQVVLPVVVSYVGYLCEGKSLQSGHFLQDGLNPLLEKRQFSSLRSNSNAGHVRRSHVGLMKHEPVKI
jgi:hypothetical protein